MLAFGKFTTELLGGVDRRVYLALGLRDRGDDICKREVTIANHHDIHVAIGGFSSRRYRAEDEGNADAVCDNL